jgi:mannan endo-1,4-beta-mannosidase
MRRGAERSRLSGPMFHASHMFRSLAVLVLGFGPGLACSSGTDQPTGGAGGATAGGTTSGGAPGAGGQAAGGSDGSAGGSGGAGPSVGGDAAGGSSAGGTDAGGSSSGGDGSGGAAVEGTFRVQGAKLLDRCGEEVVLRGVNEMIIWSSGKDGDPEFSEIAKTGANVVRIVWNEEGTAAELETAIANALKEQLIPMVEHHSATGDLSKLPEVVDYWVSPDIIAVLKKYEADLLLNIANEAGDGNVTAAQFQAAYEPAITRLREAGLVLPLILDAPSWGQNINVLQASWEALVAHDPESNLLFSVHMWWNDPEGTRVKTELAESVAAGMPLIVGEFAQHAVSQCSAEPFAYGVLLEEAEKAAIGWLAWSWGAVPNNDCKEDGPFDMAEGGVYGSWTGTWAEEVAVTHPASIKNTSVRPASIVTGSCN